MSLPKIYCPNCREEVEYFYSNYDDCLECECECGTGLSSVAVALKAEEMFGDEKEFYSKFRLLQAAKSIWKRGKLRKSKQSK